MELKVSGNMSQVQSSLDFYLKITSVDGMSFDRLRSEYMQRFLSEELERRKESRDRVRRRPRRFIDREDRVRELDRERSRDYLHSRLGRGDEWNDPDADRDMGLESVRSDEIELGSGAYVEESSTVGLKEVNTPDGETDFEEVEGLDRRPNSSVIRPADFLSAVMSAPSSMPGNVGEDKHEDTDDLEYVDHGIYIEEDYSEGDIENGVEYEMDYSTDDMDGDRAETSVEDDIESVTPPESTFNNDCDADRSVSPVIHTLEYADHGVYIEDGYSGSVDNSILGTKKVDESESKNSIEYIEHGVYIEDKNPFEDVSEVGSEYKDSGGSYDLLSETDSFGEDSQFLESDDPSDLSEDIEDSNQNIQSFYDLLVDPEEDSDSEENVSVEKTIENAKSEKDFFNLLENAEDWVFEDDSNAESLPEDIEQVDDSEPKDLIKEIPSFKSTVSMEDEGRNSADVPSDLREFLRQHPASTIEYVLKFYSKKEVEKQIALGRVFKKKGRLLI